nr:immunoglobulin light chain junction region [Macaca mulatta]
DYYCFLYMGSGIGLF